MSRGLYAAASGMVDQMIRTDVIAHNLANTATTGFKKELTIFKANFRDNAPQAIYRVDDLTGDSPGPKVDARPAIGYLPNGSTWETNYIDFSQGSLKRTDNPLDLAITGPDFFQVKTPQGSLYTRDGSFQLQADGTIVNSNGYSLLDTTGQPIVVGQGKLSVDQDGRVLVDGSEVAQIKLVSLPQTNQIIKMGENLYSYSGKAGAPKGTVQEGFLEDSNSNGVLEMVNMIQAQRIYDASSKALMAEDTATQQVITTVGRSTPG